ncbi:putative mannitol dehydrogenase [Quercus suber]|uniref:Mannitol dehydrogenase n=1 Tax=Quercus suber TaxID=58331 RepID=A0AAW0M5K9_QUESU
MAKVPPEEEHPMKAFGWAARDQSGHLSPFNFSRRKTGDEDVRFKVLYCGICHSDLHSIKNDWGFSFYPLVPGSLLFTQMAKVPPEEEHPVKAFGWAARDQSGHLSPFNFSRRETGDEDVRFKVLYCGICHSDLHSIKNDWGFSFYPLVPGHEIVGEVTEIGSKVNEVKVGDKVGVGCMVGACHSCESCKNDLENYCPKMILTYNSIYHDGTFNYGGYSDTMVANERYIVHFPESKMILTYNSIYHDGTFNYGGYSDTMVANERYIVHFPENMPLDAGAPLLCAGITVYSPLKHFGLAQPGKHIGVVGLGGLGHVAVKFAKAFGAKVTVISTSPSKKDEALEHLGADSFLVSRDPDQIQAAMNTMDGIIDTVSAVHPIFPLLGLLKSHGTLVMVGVPDKPLELPVFPLISGRKMVAGSGIGGMKETQEMINFAAKHGITADIEVVSMDYVNTAMERLAKNDVRYRFVIDIGNTLAATKP